jgi:hypothetical protein
MGGHKGVFKFINKGFLSEDSLFEPQNIEIRAFLVYLRVPITVDPVDAQFAQHLIIFQSFGLVKTEH